MLKKSVGPVLIAIIIAIVTLVKVIKTYGDFWQEAFDAPIAVVLLVLLEHRVGGIVIFILLKAISPKNKLAYAVVVALSISTFIAAPIAVSTFTGDEAAGEAESVKLSDLYNPLEKIVSEEIDEPVKETKREEIAALVARYDGKGKAGKALLEDRLDESLAAKARCQRTASQHQEGRQDDHRRHVEAVQRSACGASLSCSSTTRIATSSRISRRSSRAISGGGRRESARRSRSRARAHGVRRDSTTPSMSHNSTVTRSRVGTNAKRTSRPVSDSSRTTADATVVARSASGSGAPAVSMSRGRWRCAGVRARLPAKPRAPRRGRRRARRPSRRADRGRPHSRGRCCRPRVTVHRRRRGGVVEEHGSS